MLVVGGCGSLRGALMGDMIAKAAEADGWAGVVINGAVRDVAELSPLRLGVKAPGPDPRTSATAGKGLVGAPVFFGGVLFSRGGRLHSDEDGTVVAEEHLG
ncbi:hypothetical protein Nans01_35400 [Nocardiopsis ansamitocini]|uniref:Putative 4-hydroxy-4-methyl-2-oxoglutarate aldolase n=1 Tax=Nocardiopsis ansamitocini TaxID=1670832 RepID=A0A9W6UJT6_9ACTN|nr:hypothetical protein Nans01_35400 [Nocardiopsis ansamitocini]